MATSAPSMLLRVRCVDDGRELLIEPRRQEWRVQVATVKRLVLEQRRARQRVGSESKSEEDEEEEALASCYLLFQGRIMADSDAVNLFSLRPSDFFVFVQETSEDEKQAEEKQANDHLRRPLLEMGFPAEQVERALRSGQSDLDTLVERLTNGLDDARTARRSDLDSRALLGVNYMPELQQLAQADPFQAIMMIKEELSADSMYQLLEDPGLTVEMLRRRPDPQDLAHGRASMQVPPSGDRRATGNDSNRNSDSPAAETPIDRLEAMGFARDLVAAMYESCGFDEQLAANALLQTLES